MDHYVYWLCQIGKGESVREALETWIKETVE